MACECGQEKIEELRSAWAKLDVAISELLGSDRRKHDLLEKLYQVFEGAKELAFELGVAVPSPVPRDVPIGRAHAPRA